MRRGAGEVEERYDARIMRGDGDKTGGERKEGRRRALQLRGRGQSSVARRRGDPRARGVELRWADSGRSLQIRDPMAVQPLDSGRMFAIRRLTTEDLDIDSQSTRFFHKKGNVDAPRGQ